MKLSTKTSLNFLTVALFTFLLAIIAFYYTLRYQVDHFINSELIKAKETLFDRSDSIASIEGSTYLGSCQMLPLKSIAQLKDKTIHFQDTLILDQRTNQYLPYRQMTFIAGNNLTAFEVRIIRPLEATDNLIINLFLIMTVLVITLIIALLLINKYSSNQIWRDFYISLDKINEFNLNEQIDLELPATDIKEFEDLNLVLSRMSKRIRTDFSRMKEYTENASHEIQTPLAIISTKLEQLLQCKDLPLKQTQIIADAYNASNRLARLNQTLILLTRIENMQFPEVAAVVPQQIIEDHLENYEELILSKEIKLSCFYEPNVTLLINPYLSDILFLNLIKNAIRHNLPQGELKIHLDQKGFEILNSGKPPVGDTSKIFNRFYKSTDSSKSIGLGLAIVKKIAEIFQLQIEYSYQENLHRFYIQFPPKKEIS